MVNFNEGKLKIFHIHTDIKFIYDTQNFEGGFFDNQIILLAYNYEGRFKDKVKIVPPTVKNIALLIEECLKCDAVILYDLCSIKRKIAIELPRSVVVGWRFFGYELHSLNRKLNFSELTLKAIQENPVIKIENAIRRSLQKAKTYIKWRDYLKTDLDKVIERIDFFLCWSKEEYNSLQKYKPSLPPLFKLPLILKPNGDPEKLNKKKKRVIVGNNRSPGNNHLEVIEIIQTLPIKKGYSFVFPFSYGNHKRYIQKVRQAVAENTMVEMMENFMKVEEYEKTFNDAEALLLNYHAQGALGNIFLAIENNLKVYLNEKNCVYEWLKGLGLLVYSLNSFKSDFYNGNLRMEESEVRRNQETIRKISENYSIESFQKKVYLKISKHTYS